MSSMPREIPFDEKVNFLMTPGAYPDRPSRVESVETHMSRLFLTDSYAYKLKKPVRYAFLDFSTVAARRRDCKEEVRLNRRLAREIYLGVVSLTVDAAGQLQLDQHGRPVDWLVKMRKLPEDRMLDRLIRNHSLRAGDLRHVVEMLSNFYLRVPPEPLDPRAYVAQFENDVCANHHELVNPEFRLPLPLVERVIQYQIAFLKRHADLFYQRVRQGKIIEAHGDLRPEHICLLPQPVVIDCLEFKREFRILDAADELGFLAMECERLNSAAIGELIFETYSRISHDHPPWPLLNFYMSYRATLRAKLAIWHLKDAHPDEYGKWSTRALQYLNMATTYAENTRTHTLS